MTFLNIVKPSVNDQKISLREFWIQKSNWKANTEAKSGYPGYPKQKFLKAKPAVRKPAALVYAVYQLSKKKKKPFKECGLLFNYLFISKLKDNSYFFR